MSLEKSKEIIAGATTGSGQYSAGGVTFVCNHNCGSENWVRSHTVNKVSGGYQVSHNCYDVPG